MITRAIKLSLLLVLLTPAIAASKPAAATDHWVGTWASAIVGIPNKDSRFTVDTTLREIVHVSLGGPLVRVEFTNEFGTQPLVIGAAHIALEAAASDIQLTTANALTFGGSPSITIPPGATAISDPAALNLLAFSNLAVTIFLPAQTLTMLSQHTSSFQTSYSAPGNLVSASSLTNGGAAPTTVNSWYFLKGVDVRTPADTAAVVTFGDSITDGTASTPDTNSRWPDVLARRLAGDKKLRTLAVLNEGIGGNRLLRDNYGPSALARFDRDVLSRPGVRFLILLEGINDITRATGPNLNPVDLAAAQNSAQDLTQALVQALAQLAERAHTHGIKVLGATLTPYSGVTSFSPAGETIRQAVNQWIRNTIALDGFIDFDKATQDKSNPAILAHEADSSDHLHPSDAGYKAMAHSIDLKLFLPTASYDIRREP